MEYLIALLVAVTVLLAVDGLRRVPASYFSRRRQEAYETAPVEELPLHRGLLLGLTPATKYMPAGWVSALARQFYWAQLGGRWAGWSVTEVVALHIAAALGAGLLGVLVAPSDLPMTCVTALAGPFVLNLLYLRAPARRAHRHVQAELPELVALLAAEVAAETTIDEALARLARGTGLGAAWLRRALTGAVGESLFSQPGKTGALLREAEASGDDNLIALAINLDKISRRGTGARELLAQTARSSAARYVSEAHIRAEKVGSEIILPIVVFFFLPYVAVLLLVLAAPLLSGVVMP